MHDPDPEVEGDTASALRKLPVKGRSSVCAFLYLSRKVRSKTGRAEVTIARADPERQLCFLSQKRTISLDRVTFDENFLKGQIYLADDRII